MGAYMSKPVCEKQSEDSIRGSLSFGASAMQGWRLSQEDAHSCVLDFDGDTNTSLFAVYDGHGGTEVAQYAAEHFPEFLKTVPEYVNGNMTTALENAFLGFDATLVTEDVKKQLKILAGGNDSVPEGDSSADNSKNEASRLREEAAMPIEQLLERYGGAGLFVSRTLNELKQSGDKILSPILRAKPNLVENDEAHGSDEAMSSVEVKDDAPVSEKDKLCVKLVDKIANGFYDNVTESTADSTANSHSKDNADSSAEPSKSLPPLSGNGEHSENTSVVTASAKSTSETGEVVRDGSGPSASASDGESSSDNNVVSAGSSSADHNDIGPCSSSGSASCSKAPNESSEDSTDDDDDDDDDDDSEDGSDTKWKPDDGSGDDDDDDSDADDDDDDEDDDEDDEDMDVNDAMSFGEEPGADSGCTAVVALLRNNELYVANAGDSRCVLCRNGKAVDMSVDHKPEDAVEMERIVNAGGRVTGDGRVNGGLNLSRALGDHIYKQNKTVSDRDQMISALPDVKVATIDPANDQFMVLACDGIWNVMSSQDVVDFVKERIDNGVTKLSAICEEMFTFCLAPDTNGDGTGCDNMTCVIVAFNNLIPATVDDAAATTSGKRKSETQDNAEDPNTNAKRSREDNSVNS